MAALASSTRENLQTRIDAAKVVLDEIMAAQDNSIPMNILEQATCVGSLTDPLHLTQGVTGFMLGLLPVYLLLGSYAAIIWLWMEGRKAKSAKFLKMSCSACGIHIRFDGRNLGQNISCPHYKNDITLRKPDLLKMTCFFCKEHIEFPSHALGEKIPCPHCKMDITLKEPA